MSRKWITETYVDKNGDGTTTTYMKCNHATGFYASIERWWGKERVFACMDCCTLVPIKEMRKG